MCYTGQCKYEDYMGECNLGQLETKQKGFPEDAGCVIADKEIEKMEVKKEVLENE